MKQILLFLSVALLMINLSSCGTTKETAVPEVVTNTANTPIVKGKAVKILYNVDRTDSSTCVIDYSYFKERNFPYRDSVNDKIKKYLSLITQFERKNINGTALSNDFFSAQLDSFELVYNSEVEAEIYHLWELESTVDIDDTREAFVQLQLSGWSFTGGAHGNGATTTYIIDKSTGKELLLNDFFLDPTAVTNVAEIYFRKMYELENDASLEDAGFWFENNVFHLNNNFSVVGDKIVFLFNTYEIAPYSAGETVIEIPIEEIRAYLKVKF